MNMVRRGAALVDVVVVIGIIGILVSIVVPMMLSARDRSNRIKCANNLREIGLAMRAYAGDNKGRLPSTRPTTGSVVIPDVSNSGVAAADPFGADGPGPNNVPSIFFLLLRTQNLPAHLFVCPNTNAIPDRFGGQLPRQRSNFTRVSQNLSYAVQNPYANEAALASGFRWARGLPDSFVIAADKGPGEQAASITPNSPLELQRLANSRNHDRKGQNVLYADGRVEFRDTPFAGPHHDNIYATKSRKLLDSPQDWSDNILLPATDSAQ